GAAGVDIPTDTFNKVWITADKADIYVNRKEAKNLTAFVVASHLKVQLESDYLAENVERAGTGAGPYTHVGDGPRAIPQDFAKQLIREIILPELEKEVNEGKNFANLRQMFHSMVLAAWYKKNLKDALLTQVYADHQKTGGVQGAWVADKTADVNPEAIWSQYEAAFKKGVFNYIKEETDPTTGDIIPRKYFSGGVSGLASHAQEVSNFSEKPETRGQLARVQIQALSANGNGNSLGNSHIVLGDPQGDGMDGFYDVSLSGTSFADANARLNGLKSYLFQLYSNEIQQNRKHQHTPFSVSRKGADLLTLGEAVPHGFLGRKRQDWINEHQAFVNKLIRKGQQYLDRLYRLSEYKQVLAPKVRKLSERVDLVFGKGADLPKDVLSGLEEFDSLILTNWEQILDVAAIDDADPHKLDDEYVRLTARLNVLSDYLNQVLAIEEGQSVQEPPTFPAGLKVLNHLPVSRSGSFAEQTSAANPEVRIELPPVQGIGSRSDTIRIRWNNHYQFGSGDQHAVNFLVNGGDLIETVKRSPMENKLKSAAVLFAMWAAYYYYGPKSKDELELKRVGAVEDIIYEALTSREDLNGKAEAFSRQTNSKLEDAQTFLEWFRTQYGVLSTVFVAVPDVKVGPKIKPKAEMARVAVPPVEKKISVAVESVTSAPEAVTLATGPVFSEQPVAEFLETKAYKVYHEELKKVVASMINGADPKFFWAAVDGSLSADQWRGNEGKILPAPQQKPAGQDTQIDPMLDRTERMAVLAATIVLARQSPTVDQRTGEQFPAITGINSVFFGKVKGLMMDLLKNGNEENIKRFGSGLLLGNVKVFLTTPILEYAGLVREQFGATPLAGTYTVKVPEKDKPAVDGTASEVKSAAPVVREIDTWAPNKALSFEDNLKERAGRMFNFPGNNGEFKEAWDLVSSDQADEMVAGQWKNSGLASSENNTAFATLRALYHEKAPGVRPPLGLLKSKPIRFAIFLRSTNKDADKLMDMMFIDDQKHQGLHDSTIRLRARNILQAVDAAERATTDASAHVITSATILLAEDNELVAKAVILTLKRLYPEANVVWEKNGQAALAVYRNNSKFVRLIITDDDMPVMSGLEFIAAVRTQDKTLPIMFTSGGARILDLIENVGTIANTVLVPKPWTFEAFSGALAQFDLKFDAAANANGGINLDAGKMTLTQNGAAEGFSFDPAMAQQLRSGDFAGLTPVALSVTPVASISSLMR
ncbi:MAG: response regulator, partial [Candidatus Omnitrophica bacterium]|nr:response regulator [Candidatus Omnitrophota bacterium]